MDGVWDGRAVRGRGRCVGWVGSGRDLSCRCKRLLRLCQPPKMYAFPGACGQVVWPRCTKPGSRVVVYAHTSLDRRTVLGWHWLPPDVAKAGQGFPPALRADDQEGMRTPRVGCACPHRRNAVPVFPDSLPPWHQLPCDATTTCDGEGGAEDRRSKTPSPAATNDRASPRDTRDWPHTSHANHRTA